ncbi:MAG: hypothetical protein IKZ87_08090, partial [Actinomycetaceae bacterium]|nr:hypothetical protein [Actinomycetaceae bacterium]
QNAEKQGQTTAVPVFSCFAVKTGNASTASVYGVYGNAGILLESKKPNDREEGEADSTSH